MAQLLPDEVAALAHAHYLSLNFRPPPQQFTILAAFVLFNETSGQSKVLSLGTGSKCLPATKLVPGGDAVHDCHAEVLARRGAERFLLEEVCRVRETGDASAWLAEEDDGQFAMREGVNVYLYISTPPCGDASMRFLAASQDAAMASLKDSSAPDPSLLSSPVARGRDGYALYGVLRTKPGRADSPRTLCMSCSDKIASWTVMGVQGALGARVLRPVYIDALVVGEVEEGMRGMVKEDCERALSGRLSALDVERLPLGYELRPPAVHFTSVPFVHSKVVLTITLGEAISSCNEALCWIADSPRNPEVLINGIRRGVPPKHRWNPKFRPLLSKVSLFALHERMLSTLAVRNITYLEAKQSVIHYQTAKDVLRGDDAPFAGWIKTGSSWEEFDVNGSRRNDAG
ncbi:adenosine deaminase/editase [Trametopsis cervina]|nr:adenosine deaminase/editase [Trametopsis cervina]